MAKPLLDLARSYRAAIVAHDEAAMRRLIDAYTRMWGRISDKVDALLLEIEKDAVSSGAVFRLARYKSLMTAIEEEVGHYSGFLRTELDAAATKSVGLGLKHSSSLVTAMLQQAGVDATMGSLPTRAIMQMLGFLQEGSPLYQKIGDLAGVNAGRVRDALMDGIGLGWNPAKTARSVQDAFGGGLTDALRWCRTVDLYAYRSAALENYKASDVVTGWQWWATLDDLVCPVCIAEHGTVHSLDEELDGHFNCRCTALPYIEGMSPDEQAGADWFAEQPESAQQDILGQSKWEAWNSGKFGLRDLIDHAPNDVFGSMVREKSLAELLGE